MDTGRLIAQGTVRELTALVGESDQVHLTVTGGLEAAADAVRELPGVRQATTRVDGNLASILPQLGVLLGVAAVLMTLASWRLRRGLTR
jgi:hypothetical protein